MTDPIDGYPFAERVPFEDALTDKRVKHHWPKMRPALKQDECTHTVVIVRATHLSWCGECGKECT